MSTKRKGLELQIYEDEIENLSERESFWITEYIKKHTAKYHIKAYKVGPNDLVSSVGGGLGLFLGFSLLSTLKGTGAYLSRILNRK